jgi:DNA replication protein DnaC
MKAIGITEFLNKSFDTYEFDGEWFESFGQPEKNFIMMLYGDSGNGKTEFAIKLTKYLASFTKTLYCSYEQGISKSLQDAILRNKLSEVNGSVFFTQGEALQDLIIRLKKRASPRIVIIDSLDYMRLTTDQFKTLKALFPRKSFIIISWSNNDKPKSQYAKDIEYMADIKALVRDFKVYPKSRFGGNKPFVIWDKPAKKQPQQSLF